MTNFTKNEEIHGKWFIMHSKVDKLNFNEIEMQKFVYAPQDFFYADPFCIKRNGLNYIFFEHFDYNRGRMAYYTLDDNLNTSDIKFIDIDIKVHCSYPFLFEDNGELYIIPETCHLNKINLYKCVQFPDKWKLTKTLVDNVHAGDNTLIKHNGKYWMFTLIYKNQRNHFCIYYADDILGPWQEHLLVNQNNQNNNEDMTRGAGTPFIQDGKLMRPAQFSREGINGEFVILYEIKTLTEDNYHETPETIINHNVVKSARCMHTFNLCGDILTMDGRLSRNNEPKEREFTMSEELEKIENTNYYVNHDILKQAFSLNTSGNGKCYYGATINKKIYTGERNWDERWNLIKDCIDFNGKSILEIGCNMGIAAIYLKKFKQTSITVGVDQPDELLKASNKKDTIVAANLLAKGFGVDVGFKQIDLNKEPYEQLLGQEFDVAIAMSIYKWIDDKERFLQYLSKFKHVIYEGHDSDDVEIERFAKLGFKAKILGKTQTGQSYSPDNTRTIILFSTQ